MATVKPPRNLGERGQELWDSIAPPVYELRPDELRILADACREADLVERLYEDLEKESLRAQGYNGQPVADPVLSEIRQHRALLNTLLKSLKIPDTAGGAARKQAHTSEQARMAARARWDNRAGA